MEIAGKINNKVRFMDMIFLILLLSLTSSMDTIPEAVEHYEIAWSSILT